MVLNTQKSKDNRPVQATALASSTGKRLFEPNPQRSRTRLQRLRWTDPLMHRALTSAQRECEWKRGEILLITGTGPRQKSLRTLWPLRESPPQRRDPPPSSIGLAPGRGLRLPAAACLSTAGPRVSPTARRAVSGTMGGSGRGRGPRGPPRRSWLDFGGLLMEGRGRAEFDTP